MTLAILRERSADGFVVRLVGQFDARMADTVTQAILSSPDPSIVVDLSELVSVDPGGLQALVEVTQRFAGDGNTLRVVGARGDVLAAFRSSGLEAPSDHQAVLDGTTSGIDPVSHEGAASSRDAVPPRRSITQS